MSVCVRSKMIGKWQLSSTLQNTFSTHYSAISKMARNGIIFQYAQLSFWYNLPIQHTANRLRVTVNILEELTALLVYSNILYSQNAEEMNYVISNHNNANKPSVVQRERVL